MTRRVTHAVCSIVICGMCRYGAALALGVACAGTGLKEAVALVETLSNDPVSYVRQGALVASALVLAQQNDQTCARVAHFRQLYTKVIIHWPCLHLCTLLRLFQTVLFLGPRLTCGKDGNGTKQRKVVIE